MLQRRLSKAYVQKKKNCSLRGISITQSEISYKCIVKSNCRNIFEMNSINNHFHFRFHHVAFIYLRRLLPTISMRVLEARTIQGFLPKVNYIFEQLLAPSGLYTSTYLNENKNK